MSLQELWPYILAAGSVVATAGSISGLLSGIYLIVSKYREGPRVSLSIEACNHGGSEPDHVVMRLDIDNTGTRATSIKSLRLKAKSDGQSFDGVLLILQDRRIEASYPLPASLSESEKRLPLLLDAGRTVSLLAIFDMKGVLTAPTVKCELEMVCTQKIIKKKCGSSLRTHQGKVKVLSG
ncbi:MAG: hypothetical protein NTX81_02035 [Candidatus Bathyarchaeota archaeon]|nr:hypothetical protein [Candidatus Bathyarchaeota archaeon]